MSAGKGSRPRPVKFAKFQAEHERIFKRVTETDATKGDIIDGHECLGGNGWRTLDQREDDLRDGE